MCSEFPYEFIIQGSNMKHIMHEREDIDKFVADKEYIANTYVMRCFLISMIVYFIAFLLNILNIFIVPSR